VANKKIEHSFLSYRSHLEGLVVKICIARLTLLALLMLPLALIWTESLALESYLQVHQQTLFSFFLAAGFGANLFFLLFWRRIKNTLLLFWMQMIIDLLIVGVLILITGGLSSSFSFLFLALLFFYGRILGLNIATILSFIICLFYLGTALWQHFLPAFWTQPQVAFETQLYYFFLHILALSLILLLLKMGKGTEEKLLRTLERKEKALSKSERLRSRVLDWMENGLIVLNHKGEISVINRRAADWAGFPNGDQLIGVPLKSVYPEFAEYWSKWDKYRSAREEIYRAQDGTIFGIGFTPLPEEKGSMLLFNDITRVRELESRIQQMEKLASVGELAAGLAHEMKNPLAGIKASLQLIASDDLPPDRGERLHRVIQRDIERLDNLLKDFLVFARPSQAQPEEINLLEIINHCRMTLEHKFQNIEVDVQESLRQKTCTWDRNQLVQVVLNLFLNALQAASETEEPKVEVGLNQNSFGEFLFIQDNGPGLDSKHAGQIFDPFVTTKSKGSGLGLSIAQRLANRNKAWIELKNRTVQGAEARLYFEQDKFMADDQYKLSALD
jgi:nitrogen-specific signal transduction histidine kinase